MKPPNVLVQREYVPDLSRQVAALLALLAHPRNEDAGSDQLPAQTEVRGADAHPAKQQV